MTKQELIKWVKTNLFTKTNKLNSRRLNTNEIFYNNNIINFKEILKYTENINTNSISERIYCLINNTIPKCKCENCESKPEFITYTRGYRTYCSVECKVMDSIKDKNKVILPKITKEQIIQAKKEIGDSTFKMLNSGQITKYIRYGDENYNNREQFAETLSKVDEDGLSGYDKRAINLSKTLNNRTKEEKEFHYQKVVERRKQKDKNGLNSYDKGNYKARQSMLEIDEDGLSGYDKRNIKFRTTNIELYGVEHPNQKHIKNFDKFNANFFEEFFIINNKVAMYKAMEYYNCTWSTVLKLRRQLDKEYETEYISSYQEEVIKKLIPDGIKTRKIIYPKELDIFSNTHNFAIEYNGLMWHSFGKHNLTKFDTWFKEPENKNNHIIKTELCEEKNIQLFHIFENEWLDSNKQNIWKSMINNKMNINNRIFARKCIIKEVEAKEARKFIEENHLQGYTNASIKIGLYYENELVSIMTFNKSRYNKNIEWELIRFCSKLNTVIVGGASKLLKYFEREYKPKSLISYANRRWSVGNVYEQLGFTFTHNTLPNYFYFNEEYILHSRVKFQKHKLKDMFDNFDESLTETENMYNNGYRKIYDSGNKVYIKEYE